MNLITVKQLSKFYGRFSAIQDVSFDVAGGSITAFLGPNGAGKSTTLKILTGYIAPSSGSAHINGFDMQSQRLEASTSFGYVSEFAPLYPDMHVAGYLQYMGRLRNMSKASLNQALEQVQAQCQLQEVWKKRIRKLSKGFRQRVALAQATLHDPKVLILDEPSSGLDPNQNEVMRQFINDFASKEKAVLLSTHIFQEVEALATDILLIHQGRLQYAGPASQMISDGLAESFRKTTNGEAL